MSENKFRKKPVVIEAVQFNGNIPAIEHFMGDSVKDLKRETDANAGIKSLVICTLEGDMRADWGDWIIKGVNGEFYPCKPDIFDKTYQPAPQLNAGEGSGRETDAAQLTEATKERDQLLIDKEALRTERNNIRQKWEDCQEALEEARYDASVFKEWNDKCQKSSEALADKALEISKERDAMRSQLEDIAKETGWQYIHAFLAKFPKQ